MYELYIILNIRTWKANSLHLSTKLVFGWCVWQLKFALKTGRPSRWTTACRSVVGKSSRFHGKDSKQLLWQKAASAWAEQDLDHGAFRKLKKNQWTLRLGSHEGDIGLKENLCHTEPPRSKSSSPSNVFFTMMIHDVNNYNVYETILNMFQRIKKIKTNRCRCLRCLSSLLQGVGQQPHQQAADQPSGTVRGMRQVRVWEVDRHQCHLELPVTSSNQLIHQTQVVYFSLLHRF